jgi:isopenicillin-N N-acyltransferase like protein
MIPVVQNHGELPMRINRRFYCLLLVFIAATAGPPRAHCAQGRGEAAEKLPFQEGRFEKGELKYVKGLPVLTLHGTPEEMGRQEAALTGGLVKVLGSYPQRLMTLAGRGKDWDKCVAAARTLMTHAPQAHRDELRSFAAKAGIEPDMLTVANTIMDLYRGSFACSSLMIEPLKSKTGGVVFGRNLDFYSLGVLDRYGLITVRKPPGKHAFATVGFPGLAGCISGMNDAGLAIAVHEVDHTADRSPILNLKGVPYALAFRRLLEECQTIEEAEKLLRGLERTTLLSLAICDRKGCGVLEITAKNVVLRRGSEGICVNTNHFRSDALAGAVWELCPRYGALSKAAAADKLGVADVFKRLGEVNLGPLTVQSMVFEPGPLALHVAMGSTPATKLPLTTLDLKTFFGPLPGQH